MNDLMVKVREKKNTLLVPAVGLATMAGGALPVFASGEGSASGSVTADMTSALTTAFNGVKADVISIIGVALPPALGIMAIGIALAIGIRFFSQMAKKK